MLRVYFWSKIRDLCVWTVETNIDAMAIWFVSQCALSLSLSPDPKTFLQIP